MGGRRRAEAEAPGRLDVMGGVADYSGALVLETPIGETTRVAVEALESPRLLFVSRGYTTVDVESPALFALLDGRPPFAEIRAGLDALGLPAWVRYPLGCLIVLVRARSFERARGYAFRIESTVPCSQGMASSAALEVATLRALALLHAVKFEGTELAHLGQEAENQVVGAPCGLMDQLTCAFGEPGALLPILCRPDRLRPGVSLPSGVLVAGWPSGALHSVAESPYLVARTATFMGKRMLEARSETHWRHASEIPPDQIGALVPTAIRGDEFLSSYGPLDDPLCRVEPTRHYAVLDALRFPIEEHARCTEAVSLLAQESGPDPRSSLERVGELMLQSHRSYSSLGLGHRQTDRMVDALRRLGPGAGIYGARTSGGGSGGSVVVLLHQEARDQLEVVSREVFAEAAGPQPLIF